MYFNILSACKGNLFFQKATDYYPQNKKDSQTLHKKWSFPLGISSVNVTKSDFQKLKISIGFDFFYVYTSKIMHRTKKILLENPGFLCF